MKKSLTVLLLSIVTVLALTACSKKNKKSSIIIGAMRGPELQLVETAASVAEHRYGLHVSVVGFSDYSLPNRALSDGSIAMNVFQHKPFLDEQMKTRGYRFAILGKAFVYPMALYSDSIKNLSQLPLKAKVAIPSDPSNEARALLLFQKAGLITLNKEAGVNATPMDIVANPKLLQFIAIQAAQLPRALKDVTLAAITNTYAVSAGLSLKNAIFSEGAHSPYANLWVVRRADKNNKQLQQIVRAFQSPEVKQEARKLFGQGAIAAW